MNNCRDRIKSLAFIVHDELTVYIKIHDKIFKDAATFRSLLKNIFGRGVPMSQLLHDAELLIPIWRGINEKITSCGLDVYPSMTEDEKYYFEILKRYAQAVNEAVVLLVERQKLLNDRSKGGHNNPVNWNIYQDAERTYQSAIHKYTAIGQELNNASHLVF